MFLIFRRVHPLIYFPWFQVDGRYLTSIYWYKLYAVHKSFLHAAYKTQVTQGLKACKVHVNCLLHYVWRLNFSIKGTIKYTYWIVLSRNWTRRQRTWISLRSPSINSDNIEWFLLERFINSTQEFTFLGFINFHKHKNSSF